MKNNIPKSKYELETFNNVPKEIFEWLKNSKGKTNFALALLKNFNPIIVGDIEKI